MKAGLPSIQRRLIVGVVGVVAALWIGIAVMTTLQVRHELDELLDGHLAQAAALLVVQQMQALEDDHEVAAPTLHRYAPKVAFQVWHDGRVVLRSANAPTQPMGEAGRSFEPGFRTLGFDGLAWRVFATEGKENDVQVFVGEQVASRLDIMRALLSGLLLPAALAVPLLVLVGWWTVRRGLAPLRHMGQALRERDPRALQAVELPDATSEMAPMLDALNGLFRRIGELMEAERRFTADAAHELRTPIAAIRMQAQVALIETDGQRQRHALEAMLEGCDRATRLVEQLLVLSRLESDERAPSGLVDLADVARQTVAALAPKGVAKQQDLSLDADQPAQVHADDTLCTVLLRNLVDNALRYSPRGAQVRVAVHTFEGHCRLVVEDSGPGLSESDMERLGQRFFRVLGTDESGSGLGWSIV